MYNVRVIDEIQNYYGNLHIGFDNDGWYWGMQQYDDEIEWHEISYSLYFHLTHLHICQEAEKRKYAKKQKN